MKDKVLFLIKYYFAWVLFFVIFKVFFLLYNHVATVETLSIDDILNVFLHGLKMDFSAAGYLTLLPGVFTAISVWIKSISHKVISIYTYIIAVVMVIMGLVDMSLYTSWGTRIDSQVLPYITDPVAVVSSVSGFQLVLSLLAVVVLSGITIFVFHKIIVKRPFDDKSNFLSPIVLFIMTAVLVLPIRGGFDTAPLNFSSVYFSPKIYANHAAYNYFWSFAHALTHSTYSDNPVSYMSDEEAQKVCQVVAYDNSDDLKQGFEQLVDVPNGKRLNVILVILESYSNKIIDELADENEKDENMRGITNSFYTQARETGGRARSVTPRLNEMCRQGVVFTNFYATGTRSDRGISSLLASFPALIKASSILGFPEKMKGLYTLPQMMKDNGYDLSFYYGGDINFYNTNMLLIQSGVDNIVERSSFPLSLQTMQKWGVSDEVLYTRFADEITKAREPFFTMLYNISTHEPYDIPDHYKKISGSSETDKYLNSVAYGDSCLGAMIDRLKKSDRWSRTLIIITSDHTSRQPEPAGTMYELSSYRVPMIWCGGAVKKHRIIRNICSQTDFAITLHQQLKLKNGDVSRFQPYAKNMMSHHPYAFFFRPDGWGYVDDNIAFFDNIDTNSREFIYGDESKVSSRFAESMAQYLHFDFIHR